MPTRPVALVTGAAQRIGRTIALELASRGYDVAIHANRSREAAEDTARHAQDRGARAVVHTADLADESAVRALVPAVLASLGRLDLIVNNASSFEYDAPSSFSYSAALQHLLPNTAAPVVLAQALHQHIEALRGTGDAQRQGCVINLLDQKLANLNPDYFSYTLSKAALQAATVMLAQALAPAVRVCGLAPGVTLLSGPMSGAEFETSHRMTPLGRSSTPADLAAAVCFLAESPAITGHTLMVDGGQHLAAQARDVLFLARENPGAAS